MNKILCSTCNKAWYVEERDFGKLIVCPYCGKTIDLSANQTENLVQGMFMLIRNKEYKFINNKYEFFKDLKKLVPKSEEVDSILKVILAEEKACKEKELTEEDAWIEQELIEEKACKEKEYENIYLKALRYYEGYNVEVSYENAAKLFKIAAEKGYAPAQYKLGNLYEHGQGVKQSYKVAVRWYKKAAMQGYELAQQYLKYLDICKRVKRV